MLGFKGQRHSEPIDDGLTMTKCRNFRKSAGGLTGLRVCHWLAKNEKVENIKKRGVREACEEVLIERFGTMDSEKID